MKKKVLVLVALMLALCVSAFAIAAPVGGGTVGPGGDDPVVVAPEDPVSPPSVPGNGGHKYGHGYRFRCSGWYFARIFFFFFW